MKQHATFYVLCVALLLMLFSAWLQAQEKVTGAVNPPTATLTTGSTGELNHYCPSDDMFKKYLAQDTAARRRFEESEMRYRAIMNDAEMKRRVNTGEVLRTNSTQCDSDAELVIPVVFHLLYDAEGITRERFTEPENGREAINSLLDQVNVQLASAHIRLVRARRTINNALTIGITCNEISSSIVSVNDNAANDSITDAELKKLGIAEFPHKNYMHIWFVDQIGANDGIQGYANMSYIPNGGIVARTDINSDILVHEIGHYFNLFHTFNHFCFGDDVITKGDYTFCCLNGDPLSDGDRVADTPVDTNVESCTDEVNSADLDCNNAQEGRGLTNNYMDYGFSMCDAGRTFTPGQIARIRSTIINERPGLLTSAGSVNLNSYGITGVNGLSSVCEGGVIAPRIIFNNYSIVNVSSLQISYQLDNSQPILFDWTGTVANNTSTEIQLTPIPISLSNGFHNIEFKLLMVNGNIVDSDDPGQHRAELCHRFYVGNNINITPVLIAPGNGIEYAGAGASNNILFNWEPIPNAVYRIHIYAVRNDFLWQPIFSEDNGLLTCSNAACRNCRDIDQNTYFATFSTTNPYYYWESPSCRGPLNGYTYYWTVRAHIGGEDCSVTTQFSPVRHFSLNGNPATLTINSQNAYTDVNCPQSISSISIDNFPAATPVTDAAKTLAFTNLIFGKSYTVMPTGSSAANPGFVTGNFMQTYSSGLACGSTGPCSSYSHKGLDQGVGGSIGTVSLYAPISGIVTAVGGSTGKICIYNAELGVTFIFLHCTNIDVAPGDDVARGTYVGRAGATGASAAHVHSELRAGHKTAGSCQCSSATTDGVYDPRLVVDMLTVTTTSPTPSPVLNFPADGAVNVPIPVSLLWQPILYAEYRIQISTVNSGWTPENGFGNDIRSCDGAPITLVVTVNTAQNNAFLWDLISGCFAPLPNTTYYWTVRANTAACGTSLYSPVRSFTTAPAAPLTVSPTLMTFAATSGFGAQQTATLTNVTGPFTVTKNGTWLSYNTISGYNIIVYAASNTTTLSRQGSITITSGNQTATITVRQSGAGGCTVGTQVGGAVTPSSVWQSATGLTGGKYILFNVTQGTQYTFSLCSANGGVASYDSEMTILDHLTPTFQYAFNQTGAFGCGDDAKLTWTSPITGQVRVLVNQNHCISNAVATTLRHKTGTGKCDDIIMDAALKLYPNPASKTVNVYFEAPEEPEQVEVNLYNTLGELVYSELVTASFCSSISEIDISTFNSGLYYVSVSSSIGVVTEKLLIINK
ncbi:MAG TPA: peptidoglycan DD-metalloendopeptidase family protein [Chitinophagales bacterium]|nr:peptidoglycan DD-metalloendopeptidase family protein [Chitinophagales bacterium]HRK27877.1 peptidoglycan DD-metalloendopeptidase family protein [Chitinophagales bacterium]